MLYGRVLFTLNVKPAPRAEQPALKREGKAKLMRVFVGESDKWHDKPLYKAIVEALRSNDIAGGVATMALNHAHETKSRGAAAVEENLCRIAATEQEIHSLLAN